MAKVATDFERIIQEGRERKKNEALAQKIFSKDRRQSAPTKLKPGAGPSLASRVGVKKQRTASLGPKALPAGNIDGDWTHDLHGTVNSGGGGRGRNNGGNAGAGGLASRISAPGGRPAPVAAANNRRGDRRAEQRAAKVAAAIERSGGMADVQMTSSAPVSAPTGPAVKKGLSIRGLAGPFAVMAQNFAPGTTAADIESAMTPVGGEMLSCRIIKTSPLIVAEMVFATKEGGDAVIDTFNNQTADGRIIKVYPKPGGYKESLAANGSRPANVRSTSSHVIDGTNGFPEQMEEDDGGLYSDRIVGGGGSGGGNSGNRRGRGFNRGGRR
ncbi:pentatricopeptide repeat protein [Colletotrichum tofieldiae]|uniref:Pentatricopeptide repeat protein n=1 Tax=Colletotrichum tofieldiae TaxID=708197 RepID=A0A166SK99_9PEZI|nr:pentatricopeptide repeat protein [Colletotrichum tofieldiae]